MFSQTQSCGCKKTDTLVSLHKKNTIHGGYSQSTDATTKRLFGIWFGMIRRCENPKHKDYHHYGGRGISVCDEWRSFDNFKEWSLNNGYNEDLSIDRINVNLGYSPSNCRWATVEMQGNNKRNSRFLTYNGETHTAAEWSKISGIKYNTLMNRIDRSGWAIERALSESVGSNHA